MSSLSLQDGALWFLLLTGLRSGVQNGSGPNLSDLCLAQRESDLEFRHPRTHRIASSKTLLRFRCVRAEHSRYLCAFISFAVIRAWSYDTGSILFCLKLSRVAGSSRKSNLVPTRIMGTFGAWCSISGYHFRAKQSAQIPSLWDAWDIPWLSRCQMTVD